MYYRKNVLNLHSSSKEFILRLLFSILWLIAITLSEYAQAQEKILRASFRLRPPELFIDEKTKNFTGPLKDILDEAAAKIGYKVIWTEVPFARSIVFELEEGKGSDIVPRVHFTEDRARFMEFLGPIGYQQRNVHFLVKKGNENLVNTYQDLHKVMVGAKRRSLYFDEFFEDTKIRKVFGEDDNNLVRMFVANRFDTMIVIDKDALELELKNQQVLNYSYANYKFIQELGNYYAISKKSKLIHLAPQLQKALAEMLADGQILSIYNQYNISPPTPEKKKINNF
jgi:polar amino acid transport system substrate-binding protein